MISSSASSTQKIAFSGTKYLTDFEFGTFTPTLPAVASNTLDYATGDYVKAQNLVTINIDFKFTTAPSQMYGWIDNLPFTSATIQAVLQWAGEDQATILQVK